MQITLGVAVPSIVNTKEACIFSAVITMNQKGKVLTP